MVRFSLSYGEFTLNESSNVSTQFKGMIFIKFSDEYEGTINLTSTLKLNKVIQ
ncbi:hypothetical protein R9C05_01890 [Metamycoplasma subdolum]|uniref:hypothetical protein n=1 Tax=Metamycoplasma subdolum TaxID=92407 RepID=UPI001475BA73|nr:hypothetical protein [Metamycoplasma subdolum]WPB50340.1 hypothetical protein R9C05_01890 [Metamycoplasma subdolum]